MDLSHVISETTLASAGFFSFYYCLSKLGVFDKILWGTFTLSIAVAALCAAFWFAGIEIMGQFNLHIKKISTTAGVIYLLAGIYSHVNEVRFSRKTVYTILLLGFLSLIASITFDWLNIFTLLPSIGIPLVFILGLWALKLQKYKIGLYILLATFFSMVANFLNFFNLPFDQINTYCLLNASALICFGLARKTSL
jgi:hypothetical protein